MKLSKLSDKALLKNTIEAAKNERLATTKLLLHLCEVQRRRLFAKVACSSLFDYCVRELKMSEPHAARRINAARLMAEFPQIEGKLNDGTLSITSASQAHTFFKKEDKSMDEKGEILKGLDNLSTRETERYLLTHSKNPELHARERVRTLSQELTEIAFTVDRETMQNLQRLKELWSHSMPGASFGDIIKKMAQVCRSSEDPMLKTQVATKSESQSTPAPEFEEGSGRYVPAKVRREVWRRDGGCCTYLDEETGRRCGSRYKVQVDHIIPWAKGGETSVDNLRLRCFTHNQWHSIQAYGSDVLRYATKTASQSS